MYSLDRRNAKIICFCGIDGSGKSSIMNLLYSKLKSEGYKVKRQKLITKNGLFFKKLEPLLDSINMQVYCDLFAFERFKSISKIEKIKNKYDFILVDRYLFTDFAYTVGRGMNPDFVKFLIDRAMKPDEVFIFDVDASVAMKRIEERYKSKWAFQENYTLLSKTREAFLDIARLKKFKVINTVAEKKITFDLFLKSFNKKL